ncbi:MAG: DUF6320 domain-containing protein [Bacteroidales bacterium]
MNLCHHCGIELDEDMTECPLCGLPAGEKEVSAHLTTGSSSDRDNIFSEISRLTNAQKYKLFWEISGIILFSGIAVTIVINFIVSKNITWARYTLVASLFLFVNISFFTIWRNRFVLLIAGSYVSLVLLLLSLDLLRFNIGWGIKLGIPLLTSFYLLIIVARWLVRISYRRGFNILAIIFIAIGLFLVCTEVILSLYTDGRLILRWSIIAGSCMIPISALLFFVHFKLRKGVDLRRFFHI